MSITEEVEGLKIKNISINDLLKKEFIDKIKKLNLDVISLVLIYEEENDNKEKIIFPIVLNHQNKEEVRNKILHLQSPNSDLLKKVFESIKEQNDGHK